LSKSAQTTHPATGNKNVPFAPPDCRALGGHRSRVPAGAVAYGWCHLAVTSESVFAKLAYLVVGIPASGYLLGPTLLGVYLLASLNWWQVNQNEAFSALRIQDYKNFLRFCIKRDGSLVIYPIGVASLHDDPGLIEAPITIVPQKTGKCAP